MEINRTRYIAVCDNRARIFVDEKGKHSYRSLKEQKELCWRKLEDLKNVRTMSWHSENAAKAALKTTSMADDIDYEIIKMTETIYT